MNKMAKETTEKVTETAETLTDKTKGTVSSAWGVAKNTTEIIKDKVMGKWKKKIWRLATTNKSALQILNNYSII